MKLKKICLFHRYFYPDVAPCGQILTELFNSLAKEGYQIHVYTTTPSYRDNLKINNLKKEQNLIHPNMIIHRINLPSDSLNLFKRVLNYLRLIFYFINQTSSESFDLFVSASIPQVIGSFCVSLLAYLKSTPHIYYSMDIHPESASFSGNYKLFIIKKFLLLLDSITCKLAYKIIVQSNDMKKTLRKRPFSGKFNISIIPNPYPLGFIFKGINFSPILLPNTKKNRILYAGNFGNFQAIPNILECFCKSDVSQFEIIFVGDGYYRNLIQKYVDLYPSTFKLIDYLSHFALEQLASFCDYGLVSLSSGIINTAFPSKTMFYLSQNLPIISFLPSQSDLALQIINNKIGINVSNFDNLYLSEIFPSLKEKSKLMIKNRKPIEYFNKNYSLESIKDQWIKIINS